MKLWTNFNIIIEKNIDLNNLKSKSIEMDSPNDFKKQSKNEKLNSVMNKKMIKKILKPPI